MDLSPWFRQVVPPCGQVVVARERVGRLVPHVVVHVVGAVAHAGGGDDVVRVELAVLVAAAVRGERAPRGAPAVAGAVRVRLDGPDVDEVGRLGAVAHLASLVAALAAAPVLAAVLALGRAVPGALAAVAATLVVTVSVTAPVVRTALVVGAEAAPREAVQALRPVARHPFDGGPDPVETGRPLRSQRPEHGVVGEIRVPGDPLLPVRELAVRIGDLRIHRGQLAVDLRPGPVRHVGQGQPRVRAVDGGHLAGHVLEPPGRRTGRAFPRARVDVDRDQPTSTQDQRGRGGDRPVGRSRTFLARCASHGTPPLRGFESEA